MFGRFLGKVAAIVAKPLVSWWLQKPRNTDFMGLSLVIMPGVFHPGLYFSSRYLAKFLSSIPLEGQKVLEPGCGSGAITLYCASRGASVTGTDISQTAVRNAQLNAERNSSKLKSMPVFIESDLFVHIPAIAYDLIVVNPPYFFRDPVQESAYAWHCGASGEYFHAFFRDLGRYLHQHTQVYMVLAENCEIDRIGSIARSKGYRLEMVHQRRVLWEVNYIFSIVREGQA